MKRDLDVLVPKDWSNDRRGEYFEQLMANVFAKLRYEVTSRIKFGGLEIDLLLKHKDFQILSYVECKFYKENIGSGVITDLVGKAYVKKCKTAILISTSHLGKEAKGVYEDLKGREEIDFKFFGPDELYDLFIEVYQIKEPSIESDPREKSIGSKHLVALPEGRFFFVFEVLKDGIPSEALISPTTSNESAEDFFVDGVYAEPPSWGDLRRSAFHFKKSPPSSPHLYPEEIVATLSMAESFSDYRPCRPSDFVGRLDLQREILSYLDLVRKDKTGTRLLCLSGPSGFGKSSLLLKLHDNTRNDVKAEGLIVYPIDTRSAATPNFVALAVKQALAEAQRQLGPSLFHSNVEIQSTSSYLSGQSIESLILDLRNQQKVLLLFFDQFEETFIKADLQETFKAFERLANEVIAARSPIVLGFSWRTGIALPEDLPTYYAWHSWKDRRYDLRLEPFTSKEANEMLSLLQNYLGEKLDYRLRRHLLEHAKNLPWLLKKLCIHVLSQTQRGRTQQQVVESSLDVEELFKDDLDHCSQEMVKCLQHVARNSPIDMTELEERFGQQCINALQDRRLIIRSGSRYSVYWDVFRDYLILGRVPDIPNTFLPQMSVPVVFRVYRDLLRRASISVWDINSAHGYSEGTASNILGDLVSLGLAQRTNIGMVSLSPVSEGISPDSPTDVARVMRIGLQDNAFALALKDRYNVGEPITAQGLHEAFSLCYASRNFSKDVAKTYKDRIIKWLVFAGILELIDSGRLVRPSSVGKQAGQFRSFRLSEEGRRVANGGEFLGATGPTQVVGLFADLRNGRIIYDHDFRKNPDRNAIQDLLSLGLAYWEDGVLEPDEHVDDQYLAHALHRASESRLIVSIRQAIDKTSSLNEARLFFASSFRPQISLESAKRYFGAGLTWLRAIDKLLSET